MYAAAKLLAIFVEAGVHLRRGPNRNRTGAFAMRMRCSTN
jgi:hypothetical protein